MYLLHVCICVLICTFSYKQHNHIVTLALIFLMYSFIVKQYIFMTHGKLSYLGRILMSFALIKSLSVYSIHSSNNIYLSMKTMVLVTDGISEIGADVWSDFDCVTCLMHLYRSRVVTNLIFFCRKYQFFFHMCATGVALPSDICTMMKTN